MKVIKLGKDIETNRYECHNCSSLLSYTKYDIKTHYGEWMRTGVESSECHANKHIVCPVCNTQIILESWIEKY